MLSARNALAAVLVSATVGCAIGPDYRRPELPTPSAFRDQPEGSSSLADLPWWEVFRDETLVSLIRESLANNRDLAVAAANVEQARYLAAVQRSAFLPQLSYEVDATRGKDTTLGNPGPVGRGTENDFLALANLAWEIDLWGRIRRASEAARGELYATEAIRRSSYSRWCRGWRRPGTSSASSGASLRSRASRSPRTNRRAPGREKSGPRNFSGGARN